MGTNYRRLAITPISNNQTMSVYNICKIICSKTHATHISYIIPHIIDTPEADPKTIKKGYLKDWLI